MTSYTKKLYRTKPHAAVAVRNANRLRYGKHTTLAAFSLADREAAETEFRSAVGHCEAKIEAEFDVTERLQRWADRNWR